MLSISVIISIHALLAESDGLDYDPIVHIEISIHALLAESDPAEHHANSQQEIFLSTLSLRRATGGMSERLIGSVFLSTLSLRRATHNLNLPSSPIENFYPRSPCGERPTAQGKRADNKEISIHALLAESDKQHFK